MKNNWVAVHLEQRGPLQRAVYDFLFGFDHVNNKWPMANIEYKLKRMFSKDSLQMFCDQNALKKRRTVFAFIGEAIKKGFAFKQFINHPNPVEKKKRSHRLSN